MIPYWALFAVFLVGTLQHGRAQPRFDNRILFYFAAAGVTLMIGTRYYVGGDWLAYVEIFADSSALSLGDVLSSRDPGYALLNWLAAKAGVDVWLVNTICAAIFTVGIMRLAMTQPNPWLAMLVAVPYLIIVVAMGYTRQATAIGLICLAVSGSEKRSVVKLTVYIVIAAMFHRSAVLVFPIIAWPLMRRHILFGIAGAIATVVVFNYVLSADLDQMVQTYVEGELDSQGALIRISMNALAAILFFAMRKRMAFNKFDSAYWMASAALALCAIPAFFVLSASSGIDRISLFLIPLQMVVLSRAPFLFSKDGNASGGVLILVIGYCAAVQFVWLSFGTFSKFWLPYQTYLTL